MTGAIRVFTGLAVFLSLAPKPFICRADVAAPMNFITVRGDQLWDGDRPFRFISFNIPNLLVVEDAFEFTRPNPWRWPDEFELHDALESIRQIGGQVARTYVISVYREGSDMGEYVHVRGPGEFNEEAFRTLDKAIEIARQKRVRLIIPLVDQHKWMGGIGQYAAFRGKQAEDFWTDPQLIADFETTIRYILNRKNTYTGVAYRDEPAILGWQTGNELDAPPEWTRRIAAFIKEQDSNHLVIDGRSLHGVPPASLDDANVDVIATHYYPWRDNDFATPIRAAHALTKGKKPLIIGEFGFVETPRLAEAIDAIVTDGIAGGMLWSLRFHRREGGFYWHMEVGTGGNRYKAYHWPGFASGDNYDERQVLELVRDAAFKIRGNSPPPLEPPAAPTLLPIERTSAISWQGSAGAASYDVWRAPQASGPWEKVAKGVSDADVQYRPLWNDATVVPGKSYCYRVVARNEAGESKPSNVVGPVAVECRTLVDECRDLSVTIATEGDTAISTEIARQTQEDGYRLAVPADSAVVYHVDGPLHSFRVFSFARDENAQLDFAISSDGQEFQPIAADRWSFPTPLSVYGYQTPVLFEGFTSGQEDTYLRITNGSKPSPKAAADAAPVEISRVEIEYDRLPRSAADSSRAESADYVPAPVNPTVFVSGARGIPATLEAIDRSAERGDRRASVCVTILVDLTDDLRIKSYGLYRGRRGYQPFDEALRDELKDALGQVFARMVRHGMAIYILPHIDPGGEVQTWRNWVDFDPVEPYAGFSYEQLMIDTIADALSETVTPDTHIEMALSGEMGTSLFRYPTSYQAIVRRLRERPKLKQLRVGISLNHGGIAGQSNPTGVPDIELTAERRREMQQLIDASDFVGMSFYRPVRVDPTTDDFVRGIEHFLGEFRELGLSVPTTTPMQFSEVGLGGGDGDEDATSDPAKAVASPWAGSGDPRINPWRNPDMQALRRRYHRAMLQFLREQPGPRQVSAAFFWSTGSWDPQGVRHPVFADPEIVAAVARHNRGAAAKREPEIGRNRGSASDEP